MTDTRSIGKENGVTMEVKVFCLNDKKYLETSTVKAFFASIAECKSPHWVDIIRPDSSRLEEFLTPLRLHPQIMEEYRDPAAGSHIAPYEQTLFIKLPIQLGWDNLNSCYLSIICLPQAIITIHESPVSALENIAKEFSAAMRFHSMSAFTILYQILDRLIDENMAFVLEARRQIESLDEALDQEPDAVQVDQILTLKRYVARLSITFEDQRHCVTALQTIESEVFDITDFREYFRDSLAHLEYVLRSVGRQHAHLFELHQHYLITLQDKTNKRIRLLTILSAIFMPLTLIAGIYGMNFRYMPEIAWRFGYPLVIVMMIVLAGGLLWVFYRKGWFK